MGKRGPKPKPAAIKKAAGNPGRRPLNEAEPVSSMPIDPPAWLSENALAEWRRVVPELVNLRVVSGLDLIAVAQYCEAVADWIAAKSELRAKGNVVEIDTASGATMAQVSPWYSIARQLGQEVKRLAGELGLTPSSRSGIRPIGGPSNKGSALGKHRDKVAAAKGKR